MPKFNPRQQQRQPAHPAVKMKNVPRITVGQCHVCTSPHRDVIEEMIVRGTPYKQISELIGGAVERRSISRHAKEHLQWERQAIQRIIEEETAKAEANIEEGVNGVVARRVYLKVALEKATEALLNGDTPVTPKEALGIIDKLDEYEDQISGAKLDAINAQFQAFLQAMRELVPQEYLSQVLERTQQIVDGTAVEITDIQALDSGDESPST